MKYKHVLSAFAAELWAIEEAKFLAMVELLAFQAEGGKFSAAEIEARIGKGREAETASRQGAVAVLPLRGVITNRANMMNSFSGGTSAEQFAAAFQAALHDDGVKAIVLDVDSPGGAVAGTDELSSMIHEARGGKPIVAQVNATAASAAYWIASAADETAVTPSARVGSVGVIWSHQDASKAMKREGVKTTMITAKDSPYKSEGHPFGPLGDEAAAHVQREVDEAGAKFVGAVARNRNVAQGHVREHFGKGRMLDADRAVAAGMADRVATMHQTLQRFGSGLYPTTPAGNTGARRAFAAEREKRALQL